MNTGCFVFVSCITHLLRHGSAHSSGEQRSLDREIGLCSYFFFSSGGNFSNIFFTSWSIVLAFLHWLLLRVLVAVPRQMYLLLAESPMSTMRVPTGICST